MRQAPKSAANLHQLRSRIERGRYEVKPDRVAEAMIRRGIVMKPVDQRARPG